MRQCRLGTTLRDVHQLSIKLASEGIADLRLLPGQLASTISRDAYREFYPHSLGKPLTRAGFKLDRPSPIRSPEYERILLSSLLEIPISLRIEDLQHVSFVILPRRIKQSSLLQSTRCNRFAWWYRSLARNGYTRRRNAEPGQALSARGRHDSRARVVHT